MYIILSSKVRLDPLFKRFDNLSLSVSLCLSIYQNVSALFFGGMVKGGNLSVPAPFFPTSWVFAYLSGEYDVKEALSYFERC